MYNIFRKWVGVRVCVYVTEGTKQRKQETIVQEQRRRKLQKNTKKDRRWLIVVVIRINDAALY